MESPVKVRDTGITVTEILALLARGYSYPQILEQHPRLIVGDIMAAVQLAHDFIAQYVTAEDCIRLDHVIQIQANSNRIVNISKVREEFPRAFMPWKADEEARLVEQFKRGGKISDLARSHQRNPGAIRSRLAKLGLISSPDRSSPRDSDPPERVE
jgi:uncharacterized protein (DUF433 family)